MAALNLTVEDCSPLISYAPPGAWTDAVNDPLLSSYSGASLHTTSSQNATATINFNGTGISIFGGLRSNYGTYSISVDGQNVASSSASSQQPEFQQLLGSASGLSNGPHTAIITSTGTSPIDIDFATIQSQIGSSGAQLVNTTIDDTNSAISYQPPDAWQVNMNNEFFNNTLHFTNVSTATASLSFSGEAVAIWGTVSSDHANLRVTLDGQTSTFNAGSGGVVSTLHPQILLFFADSLSSGEHTLTLGPDQESNTGLFADIDAVQVFSTTSDSTAGSVTSFPIATTAASGPSVSLSTTSLSTTSSTAASGPSVSLSTTSLSTTSSAPDQTGPSRKVVQPGVLAGIVVGSVVVLALIATAIFLILRRRRRRSDPFFATEKPISSPKTPELPIQLDGGYLPDRPAPVPPYMGAQERYQTPLVPNRGSTYSISSYYTHSTSNSVSSSTPMVPIDVPIIKVPRPPAAHTQSRSPNGLPVRPKRAPSLGLTPEY